MARLIGICGGIGSGKSVVSRVLRCKGYEVYDCDIEARCLMEASEYIKRSIRDEISAEVTDGESAPDRAVLARIVFSDEKMRLTLNRIVHGVVRADVECRRTDCRGDVLFVEAAILAESGLADMCDEIWLVTADEEERIRRVTARDACDRSQALARIASQRREEELLMAHKLKIREIWNDEKHSLLAQLAALLASPRGE